MACINIRGSTSAVADIRCLIQDTEAPDVLILTETKRKKPQFMCKDISSRYTVHNSNTADGNGGLIMLLDRKYSKVGAAIQQEVPRECKGYLIHMAVGMPYTATLHIVGVYMPGDETYAHMRPVVYQQLAKMLQALPDTDTAIVAGDWNAALCEVDRATALTSTDKRHATWVQDQPRLKSVYTTMNNRQPTYTVSGMGDSPSMIDDILLQPPTGVCNEVVVYAAEIHQGHGYNTDHALMTASLSGAKLNAIHVTSNQVRTRPTPARRLQTPVKATARQAFHQRLLENASALIQQLNGRLAPISQETIAFLEEQKSQNAKDVHKLDMLGGRPADEVVDELGNCLMAILSEANVAALETCATVMTNPGGVHHKPKMACKQRRQHMATLKRARQLCGQLKRALGTAAEPAVRAEIATLQADVAPQAQPSHTHAHGRSTEQNCDKHNTRNPAPACNTVPAAAATISSKAFGCSSTTDEPRDTDLDTLCQISRMKCNQIRELDTEHRKESVQLQQDTLRRLLTEKPKQGHKMLFATAGAQQHRDLEAVLDPATGRITTDPARVPLITESIFREQQRPPTGYQTRIVPPRRTTPYPRTMAWRP